MSNPSEAPAKPGTPEPSKQDMKTPDEWRKVVLPDDPRGRQSPTSWKHAAAAALHGWAEHAHHEGAPMRMVRADYEAALAAASTIPQGKNAYAPHPAALSSHSANAKKG
jgi:hypothetical protein